MNRASLSIATLALALGVAAAVIRRSNGDAVEERPHESSLSEGPGEDHLDSPLDLELATVAPGGPSRAKEPGVQKGATSEISNAAAPAPELADEPEDPRDERWRAKYRGMTADQLEAENERISILYTTEMSKITWPRFQSGECSYADPTKGERPPPSKPGALVAVASQKGGRVPYVVVTEDEAPVLHEWMSELAWLLAETERLRASHSD